MARRGEPAAPRHPRGLQAPRHACGAASHGAAHQRQRTTRHRGARAPRLLRGRVHGSVPALDQRRPRRPPVGAVPADARPDDDAAVGGDRQGRCGGHGGGGRVRTECLRDLAQRRPDDTCRRDLAARRPHRRARGRARSARGPRRRQGRPRGEGPDDLAAGLVPLLRVAGLPDRGPHDPAGPGEPDCLHAAHPVRRRRRHPGLQLAHAPRRHGPGAGTRRGEHRRRQATGGELAVAAQAR